MNQSAETWIVSAHLDACLVLPGGEVVDRAGLHDWLWERAAGLLGIDEGATTVAEAAAHGVAPDPLVVDTAAAPADRDWLAGLAVATVTWWFADETAARAAAALLSAVRGCRVDELGPHVPSDGEPDFQSSFPPVDVPGFGVVRPAWEAGRAGITGDDATIFVMPGLGFGTGLHETTQLCLAAVAARRRQGGRLDRVLDFGSGSGILAIAAAVLGAVEVDAVEVDDRVHAAIRENANRNAVTAGLHVLTTLPADTTAYDLVIANIVAPVLLEHAADLCARMRRPGGGILLSGLRRHEVVTVADRFTALVGAQPLEQQRGGWHCLSFACT